MIHLNLLPENQKKALEKDRLFLVAHNFLGVLFLLAAVLAIALMLTRFALIDNYNRIKEETSLVNVGSQVLNKEIDLLNQKITLAAAVQQGFAKWSALLGEIGDLLPNQVRLNYLFINKESGALRLSGRAADRNSLLSAKDALETSGLLELLQAPLSNLTEKVNVEFRLNGTLKKDVWQIR